MNVIQSRCTYFISNRNNTNNNMKAREISLKNKQEDHHHIINNKKRKIMLSKTALIGLNDQNIEIKVKFFKIWNFILYIVLLMIYNILEMN